MNVVFGQYYDNDVILLENFVYKAITKGTAKQNESGAYIFELTSLPITLPNNAILRSKICRNLEEFLEYRLLINGKHPETRDADEDEDDFISANVEVVDDILKVSI